jgi:hypothetical protein
MEHKRGSIEAQREPIDGRIRDFRERMQSCRADIEACLGRIALFREEMAESEAKITE